VSNNTVRDSVNRFEPAGTSYGIVVSTQTTTDTTGVEQGNIVVSDNRISRIRGHAIHLRGNPFPINGLKVADNHITDCLDAGINIEYEFNGLTVVDNYISGCGRRSGGATPMAIRVAANVIWKGGRIENNTLVDFQAAPTQENAVNVHAAAQLTGVARSGNTGDPAPTVAGGASARKNSTTTVNNNSTLATVSAFSLPLEAGASYQFEAIIEFSADAAAGLKLRWALPANANISWTVDGAGAPVLVATSQAVYAGAGVGVLRAARVSGLITVGDTAGALTLTAAQSTAHASDTVITTRSVMSIARA